MRLDHVPELPDGCGRGTRPACHRGLPHPPFARPDPLPKYDTLPGTLLERLGKLLVEDVRLYIHPVPREAFLVTTEPGRVGAASSNATVSLDDLRCEPPLDQLLGYLRGAEWIVPLELS